jgi:hypothetical protein
LTLLTPILKIPAVSAVTLLATIHPSLARVYGTDRSLTLPASKMSLFIAGDARSGGMV